MKPGNKFLFSLIIFFFSINNSISEDKILSTPLINLNEIKPSFEEFNEKNESSTTSKKIKKKKKTDNISSSSHAVLIGLDKITAKSSEIIVNLEEIKKFGALEINTIDDVAYMQVKDLTKNENEKVFIFNGWTFASDPNLTPFDHAIYDLQLLNCYNA